MSIKSKIQSLISAANNETGESDTTLTDAVQTLVDGYGQGGEGGSLPSVISKIDGGSFTLASDQQSSAYDIAHSLGIVPKGFAIWTEGEISGTVAARHMVSAFLAVSDVTNRTDTNYSAMGSASILYNGNNSAPAVTLTSAQISGYMDSVKIKWNNSLLYYKAGCVYKWLAWA